MTGKRREAKTALRSGWLIKVLLVAVAIAVSGTSYAQFGRVQLRGERTVIRGGLLHKPDSLERAKADSALVAGIVDSLRKMPTDSLANVADSLKTLLPDSVRRAIFADRAGQVDSLAVDSLARDSLVRDSLALDSASLTEKQLKRLQRRENRKPLLSDSMALRKVCWASLVLPGFGQIYNKQYWKLPILYGTFGTTLGMFIYENNKYKPLKRQYDALTDQSMVRTEELDWLQARMIKHNTWRQVFLVGAIASYLYFIGDAAVCYATNEVSAVNKATTLSTICPGAGQIYNKSYWRVPIVVGGFATTIYCIDWNNRGYQRFKKAYRLRYDFDQNPDKYPDGSQDEFRGRYSATFLKNLRDSYRRNRDLCIILTAGLYILQIVDAHVDAHLRDYDISNDLGINVSPMIDYNPALGPSSAAFGMNLNITF